MLYNMHSFLNKDVNVYLCTKMNKYGDPEYSQKPIKTKARIEYSPTITAVQEGINVSGSATIYLGIQVTPRVLIEWDNQKHPSTSVTLCWSKKKFEHTIVVVE